tara:strand:- start:5149 stop:5463 length:315 start_codon:yes stop_codon:yes gene_type:complete
MKNNKLIAEFMGFTSEKNIGWYDNNMMMPQSVYDSQDGNCFDDLLFDKSWDWLIPVVENIFERLDSRDNSANEIKKSMLLCCCDATYNAVVFWIKENNNNYKTI